MGNRLHSLEIRQGITKNELYFKGYIQRFALTDTLEYYGIEIKGTHEINLFLKSEKDSAIYMCFNLAGKTSINLKYEKRAVSVPPFTSILIPNTESETISCNCESGKMYDFMILKMERSHLNQAQLAFFQNIHDQKRHLRDDELNELLLPNLAICDMARKLKEIDKTTWDNKYIAHGYGNILIGLKLKELLSTSEKVPFLRSFEIQQLEDLTEEIKRHPHHDDCFSIKK